MEILTLILFIVLGIIAGTITGLTPGVHINLISSIIIANSIYLLTLFNQNLLVIFIISMSTTHTFLDFIPSILFGIPDSDTSLSILPTQKMVIQGDAYKAIVLSSIGSFCGIIFTLLIIPIFLLFLKKMYESITSIIPYFLLFSIIILILLEKQKNKIFWSIIITLFSGSLGILVLNTKLITNPLLVLFTGLFAIPGIIIALREKIPKYPAQNLKFKYKFNKNTYKSLLVGGISATACSITPGIGNSQAATLSSLFFKNPSSENFLITVSSINTINFSISILTFYLIERARNGSIIAISQIKTQILKTDIVQYIIIIVLVSILAFFLTIIIGKFAIQIISNLNITKLNLTLLLFLIIIIYTLTNIYGLIILLTTTCLGLMPILFQTKRVHLMNVLIIPIIINLI